MARAVLIGLIPAAFTRGAFDMLAVSFACQVAFVMRF